MSIIQTKGQGKVLLTGTPISAVSWMAKYYQQNQTQKNLNFDTIRKLVIQNYAKDLMSAVFWGWDIITASETEDSYLFQLANRENPKLRVYITLSRILQQPDIKYPDEFYQCYIHDDAGEWSERIWLGTYSLNHKEFWGTIESIVDAHHPLYPF